jgi:hypothetical protein
VDHDGVATGSANIDMMRAITWLAPRQLVAVENTRDTNNITCPMAYVW